MYKALDGGWEVRLGKDFVPVPVQEQMGKRTDWGKLLKIRNRKTQPGRGKGQEPVADTGLVTVYTLSHS